jgi:hypothetical protein
MLDTEEYPENTFSSPFKVDPQAHESQTDDDDGQSMTEAPSSPFQYDGRDDTVDFRMLQQQKQTSLAPSEHSATPRKRSYEYAPDEDYGRDGVKGERGVDIVWVGKENSSHLRYQQYPRVGQVESRVQSRDVILEL